MSGRAGHPPVSYTHLDVYKRQPAKVCGTAAGSHCFFNNPATLGASAAGFLRKSENPANLTLRTQSSLSRLPSLLGEAEAATFAALFHAFLDGSGHLRNLNDSFMSHRLLIQIPETGRQMCIRDRR